jgi:hypothetical protein
MANSETRNIYSGKDTPIANEYPKSIIKMGQTVGSIKSGRVSNWRMKNID